MFIYYNLYNMLWRYIIIFRILLPSGKMAAQKMKNKIPALL